MMSDIRKQSTEELVKLIAEKKEALRGARFDLAGTAKKGTRSVRSEKKEIARSLTEINARVQKTEN